MNVNEQIIRPLLGFASTVALFPDSHDHHCACSRKRNGIRHHRAAAHLASDRYQIILGKWLGAMLLYLCVLAMSMINIALAVRLGASRTSSRCWWPTSGLALQGGCLLAIGTFYLHHHRNQIVAGGGHLLHLPAAVAAEAGSPALRLHRTRAGWSIYLSIVTHFENFG